MQASPISNSFYGSQRRKTISVRLCEPCCLAKQSTLNTERLLRHASLSPISNSFYGSQRRKTTSVRLCEPCCLAKQSKLSTKMIASPCKSLLFQTRTMARKDEKQHQYVFASLAVLFGKAVLPIY